MFKIKINKKFNWYRFTWGVICWDVYLGLSTELIFKNNIKLERT